MKNIIVIGFDRVLINDEEEIPTSTIVLFDELRRKNKKIVIVTDSPLNRILYYNYSFPFIDYIVSSSGSYIYDTVKDKTIYKKNILYSNVNKIIKTFHDICKIYVTDDKNYNLINGYSNDEDVCIIDNYQEYLDSNKTNIYKIELDVSDLNIDDIITKLNSLNLKVNVNIDDDTKISIVHEEVNKFNSLKVLVSKMKKELNDIVYIGRDIEIIENISFSVTTKDDIPYLNEISKYITDDCNNKGVEKFLSKYYEKED